LVVDQLKVVAAPDTMDAGLAANVTVGAGVGAPELTVTVAVACDVPAELEHASV
jgi:hypothetical protein